MKFLLLTAVALSISNAMIFTADVIKSNKVIELEKKLYLTQDKAQLDQDALLIKLGDAEADYHNCKLQLNRVILRH